MSGLHGARVLWLLAASAFQGALSVLPGTLQVLLDRISPELAATPT